MPKNRRPWPADDEWSACVAEPDTGGVPRLRVWFLHYHPTVGAMTILKANSTATTGDSSREVFPLMEEKSPALRVLVVDDEALIRWSIVETLTDLGCSVVEAGDGEGALRTLTAP